MIFPLEAEDNQQEFRRWGSVQGCSAMIELYLEMLYYMSSLNVRYMQTLHLL